VYKVYKNKVTHKKKQLCREWECKNIFQFDTNFFFGFLVEIKKIDNWTKEKKRNVRERKHRSLRNIKCTHKNVYKCCCSVTEQKKNKSINLKKINIPLKGKKC